MDQHTQDAAAARVVVRHDRDRGWHVELDGLPLQGPARGLSAIEAEELAEVVELAIAGDEAALERLERDGIEPPVLEPDDTPMPCLGAVVA